MPAPATHLGLALVVGAAGLLAPSRTSAVMIMGYRYQPGAVSVQVGDTVTWTNHDQVEHDVSGSGLQSPRLGTGKSWSHTFTAPGTYSYICSIHPDMTGSVVVEGAPAPPPTAPPATAAPTAPPVATAPAAVVPTSPRVTGVSTTAGPVPTGAATTVAPTSTTTTAPVAGDQQAAAAAPVVPASSTGPDTDLPLQLVAAVVAAVALASSLFLLAPSGGSDDED